MVVEGVVEVAVVGGDARRSVVGCGPDDLRGNLVHGADARRVRVPRPQEEA